MLLTSPIPRLISVGLAIIACHAAIAAPPTDVANYMPPDTALYVGWSQWLEQDSPDLGALDVLAKAVAEETDDEGAALAAVLLDALGPLETGSAGIGLFDVVIMDGQPDVQLAAVVDAGPQSAGLTDAVRKIIALHGDPNDIQPQTVKDVPLQTYTLNATAVLFWGLHKDCFIVSLGETAAGKVIDCMNGTADCLADVPEFKFDRDKVKASLDGRYLCFYADVQRLITRGAQVAAELLGELPPIVDQLVNELGFASVRSKYVHFDRLNDQPRMMGFAHLQGPLRGLLTLWNQQPLTDDDLKIVPRDAYWMQVNNLDLSALWTETMRVTAAAAPDVVPIIEGSLAMAAGMVGFSITDDLLPAFGDTWAFFDAPDHGGLLMTGTILVAEVKDAAALQGMLTRATNMAAALLTQSESASLLLRETQHGQHTIHYLTIAGVPCPVMPAWGFVDDRFVFGLYPQTVATAMKQVDPQMRGPSILDHPDFRATRAQLPAQALGIAYYDSKYFVRMFYPFINGLSAAGLSMVADYGLEMDFDLLPLLPDRVAKTTNYVGTSSVDPDGILYASIGDGAPLAVVAGGTAGATSILLPSLARARHLAKREVSAANLRGIGQGCHVYAHGHKEKFPDSLEQLVVEGMCTADQLQSPPDPEGTISYVYIARQTEADHPVNVLVYERIRSDEGTNVLFLDGHVEFMEIDQFKQVLQDTYRRLGREDEIPPEFRE